MLGFLHKVVACSPSEMLNTSIASREVLPWHHIQGQPAGRKGAQGNRMSLPPPDSPESKRQTSPLTHTSQNTFTIAHSILEKHWQCTLDIKTNIGYSAIAVEL